MADAPATGKQFEEVASKVLDVIDRPREREVVERRFGLTGAKETLESVGETLGITRERVRQIEKATLIRAKISLDDGKNLDSHDPVEQTHKVMQNIRQLIEEAGGKMEHLVKVVVYITDVRHREAVYRTMGEYLEGVHPVSTGLVVQALARPEWLVEIDGTAVIPE